LKLNAFTAFVKDPPYEYSFNKPYSLELMLILVDSHETGAELSITGLHEMLKYNKLQIAAFRSYLRCLESYKLLEIRRGTYKRSLRAVRLSQDV